MATIVTRSGKGSPLTNAEVDGNFTNLNTELGTKANASSLATVATSGAYADLTGRPTNVSSFTNDSAYLTSFTEADPTVPSHVKAITTTNISNWNTAFGWGNHASAGYLTGITSGNVTTALGFTPYNATNPAGYITSSALSPYALLSGAAFTGNVSTTAAVVGTSVTVNTGGTGFVGMYQGGASYTGYLGFFNAAGDRQAYVGFAPSGGGTFAFAAEGSTGFDFNKTIYAGSGLTAAVDVRAPIFYDTNDTSRYVDPTGVSTVNILNTAGYIQTYNGGVKWDESGTRSWSMYPSGGAIGLYSGDGGGSFTVGLTGGTRSPIYYDSNDTAYYVDPNTSGTSAVFAGDIHINDTTWGADKALRFREGATNEYGAFIKYTAGDSLELGTRNNSTTDTRAIYISRGANWAGSDGSFRAPIFYDSNDTSYYVDPYSGTNVRGSIVLHDSGGASPLMDIRAASSSPWALRLYRADLGGGAQMYARSASEWYHSATLTAASSMRAPIFYDEDNTGYYVDPATTSNLNGVNVNGTLDVRDSNAQIWRSTNGAYQRVDTRTEATSLSRAHWYGVNSSGGTSNYRHAWYDNAAYFNVTAQDGEIIFERTAGEAIVRSAGSFRAPIFYDSNNTGYYTDPASTSVQYRINVLNGINLTGGIALTASGATLDNSIAMRLTENYGALWSGGDGTLWHHQVINASMLCGFTGAGTNWGSGNIIANGYLRGTMFYDQSNTAYYVDPNSTSVLLNLNLNGGLAAAGSITVGSGQTSSYIYMADSDEGTRVIHCNTQRIGFLSQADSWGSWCDDDGSWRTDHAMYSPVYYDINNTAYYTDPASTSNLNKLTASGRSMVCSAQISMSGLDANTYYPVTIPIPVARQVTLRIENALNSNVPSWSTHPSGFSCYFEWTTNGLGWGTIGLSRRVTDWREQYASVQIVGGVDQMTFSSQEVIWLRGGANYFFSADCDVTPTVRTTSYDAYGQVVAPRSTVFNDPWETAQGKMSYGTFQATVRVTAGTDMRAPVFYDSNDTSRYVDPNSGGVALRTSGYWVADSTDWAGDIDGKIQRHANSWYFSASNNWVFRATSGAEPFIVSQAGVAIATASMRAPIFYDNNNTAYYVDPQSGSAFQGALVVGPNTSGKYTRFGGNGGASDMSTVSTSNGNLHIDAETGSNLYLAWYNGSTVQVGGGIAATIYYDRENTGYYVDPNSSSRTGMINADNLRTQNNVYIDQQYGSSLVGAYNSVRYQGVYAMGDSYKLAIDGTTAGNLYGIAWAHPNAGGVAANLNTHGALFLENGGFLAAVSGSIRCRDDMRAPVYYDSNNTAFGIDGSGTSTLNRIVARQSGVSLASGNSSQLEINNAASGACNISFHREGAYGAHFGLDTDNVFKTYGWSAGGGFTAMEVGNFTANGSITATGNVTAYSDIRIKANVETIPDALDKLDQIRGVTYTRTDLDDKEQRYAGVIAQEIEKVLPEAVRDLGNIKAVDYNATIGLLIQAVKELRDEVETMKSRLH